MIPLATKLRPQKLEDFVGQEKVINPKSFLYEAIMNDNVPSLIFWGPPGSGKTTLALIIAKETKADFKQLSAVNSGVKDLRLILDQADVNSRFNKKTILFIDEIHRWNKAQQDALLPEIENGRIILIGATTENPSFAVISALLSRCRTVVLDSLSADDLNKIIVRAGKLEKVKIKSEVIKFLAGQARGDARTALNILENCLKKSRDLTIELVKEVIHRPNLLYDKNGDEHYNIISALHKSLRGGDPGAAVYWLVRMIAAGEDPLYIARRLIRFASEDIGLANSSALMLANETYSACQHIGLPECGVNLAHCAIYLAKSPKSIAAYEAYELAQAEVAKSGALSVPVHLRNAPTKLMKDLGYGKEYKYTPKEDSSEQEYLPPEVKNGPMGKIKFKN